MKCHDNWMKCHDNWMKCHDKWMKCYDKWMKYHDKWMKCHDKWMKYHDKWTIPHITRPDVNLCMGNGKIKFHQVNFYIIKMSFTSNVTFASPTGILGKIN